MFLPDHNHPPDPGKSIYVLANETKIPFSILEHLLKQGLISSPLVAEDYIRLGFLERIWCDRKLLRSQLGRFSFDRRVALLETSSLESKWEQYAFSSLRNLPPGTRLPMSKLIAMIEKYFGFRVTSEKKNRLKQIYRLARNNRYRSKIAHDSPRQ